MKTEDLTRIAMIAAIYTALTLALAPLSFGMMQIRFAEALTMLPLVYMPSVWGVALGCFLANLVGVMTGANALGAIDCIVGTVATLIAAWCTWKLRDQRVRGIPLWSILMPAVWNFLFIGTELGLLFPVGKSIPLSILINGTWVAIGELAACVLGYGLVKMLVRLPLFKQSKIS